MGYGSLIAHCDVCSKCKPDNLSSIIGKHTRPSKAKDELARSRLSVEKSKFYDRLREISQCGPALVAETFEKP